MSNFQRKKWVLPQPIPSDDVKQIGLTPVLAQILHNRGIAPADMQAFLSANSAEDLQAMVAYPVLCQQFRDLPVAVSRILRAIDTQETIVVYGDFDCDGVTATTLLMQVLTHLGAHVRAHIPDRVKEGYGLNSPALHKLADEGVSLVVTVDCGIRSVDEIEYANTLSLDVIVTDHHSVGQTLPEAVALVHPALTDGSKPLFEKICGCGVAFMLALGLLKERNPVRRDTGEKMRMSDLLDLVAIGTVADMMDLQVPINRLLVHWGITTIREGRRLGIRVLVEGAGVGLDTFCAQDIGFAIGPRINAAGRLESAMCAHELLATTDLATAQRLAETLNTLNSSRQTETRDALARVNDLVTDADSAWLIFVQDDKIKPGIVGLVAGKLTEEYYRPSVILHRDKDTSRASCRSIPEFDITRALDECAELLMRHGGHAMAAGFTVHNDNVERLRSMLQEKAKDALSNYADLSPRLSVDVVLGARDFEKRLVKQLDALEPTGHGNTVPVFMSSEMVVVDKRQIGKGGAHLKLSLKPGNQPPLDVIGFGMGACCDDLPDVIDVAYNLEINAFQGRENLQLRLIDWRPAGIS